MPPCHVCLRYLPHGGRCHFPLCTGKEVIPFCPCAVPAAVTTRLLTYRGESGTETHIPIAIGTIVIQIEGKKARAACIIVIAAAQRQPLHY